LHLHRHCFRPIGEWGAIVQTAVLDAAQVGRLYFKVSSTEMRLSAELAAPRGDHGRARRVGRSFVVQSVADSCPATHQDNGAETQASGRQQLAHQ